MTKSWGFTARLRAVAGPGRRSTRRGAVLLALAALASLLPVAARADQTITAGDVTYTKSADRVTLGNGAIERTWRLEQTPTGLTAVTATFRDVATGTDWTSEAVAPDFALILDSTTSVTSADLRVRDVTGAALSNGITVRFTYEPADSTPLPKTLWIERDVTLNDHAALLEESTILHNASPAVLSIQGWKLDEVASATPAATAPVEVQRYVGGSDWRDDFRAITARGELAFDAEGEVVRAGDGEGWFMVSERRGGAASRAGRDDLTYAALPEQPWWTATWVGADFARDVIDLGPLADTPPDYNRVENPAYPLPVRTRHVAPLSNLDLGNVAVGVYHGGAQQAAVSYADWVARYREPQNPRRVQLNSFHPWSHGAGFVDATIRAQADVAASLGIDTIVLDDQWQGGPGGENGDWAWDASPSDVDGDPARFPPQSGCDKPAGIICYIEDVKHLRLGLWMSPAEFSGSAWPCKAPPDASCMPPAFNYGPPGSKVSTVAATHPEWICTPVGDATSQNPGDVGEGVWDFTNPGLRGYLTGVIRKAVEQWGVSYFKFDFQTWVDCPPHDYNDYEDAFAHWVDDLERCFPDVTFTFDETNDQRMYAFESVARGPSWFDNAHNHTLPGGATVKAPAQVLHDVWMASPWVPPSTIGAGVYDGTIDKGYDPAYLMPIAALTHMTFWTDLTKLSGAAKAETAWWLAWYHAHSTELAGGVYNLTLDAGDPWDDAAPAAFQTWSGDHGLLFAFRQGGGAPAVRLQGLDTAATYTLTDVRTGAAWGSFTGAELSGGVQVPLTAPHSAAVYAITA